MLPPGVGWAPAVATEDAIYVGVIGGEILALDSFKLSPKWRYPRQEPTRARDDRFGGVYNAPVVKGDTIYVAGYNGKLYAFNKNTGERLREYTTKGRLVGGPVVAGSKVLVGSEDGRLYAFDANEGEQLWVFPANGTVGPIWSTPVVDSGRVFFGSIDQKLYAVSLEDGKPLWLQPFKAGGAITARPLVIGDLVIVGSFDKKLYAVNASTGKKLWSFEASNWFWGGAATDGTVIYAPSLDGKLYALTLDGRLKWEFSAQAPIISTPVVVDKWVVVATDAGLLYQVSRESGRDKWFLDTGSPIRGELANIGPVFYFGTTDQSFRSVDVLKGEELLKVTTKR